MSEPGLKGLKRFSGFFPLLKAMAGKAGFKIRKN